ncbi:MAG TPA: hypothetical protein VFH06_00495 [Candidatus Saccharimonadales bacterium]|nr:hypothetical protein [Candidatus Saccharimonadales bacterium]
MKKYLRYIILGGIIVVVVCASSAIAVWLSFRNSSESNQQSAKQQEATQESKQVENNTTEADKLAYGGDVQGGVEVLDNAIKNSADSHAKFQYYSQKALLLFNNNKLSEALVAAKQAFEQEQTKDGAAFVGQIARQLGDRATAIDYYKKAINLVDTSSSPMGEKDKKYYTSIVTDLEAGR